VLTPELTEGPYFVDERLNRSNLTTGTANTNVTGGVPLSLTIGIVSASSACQPLHGLQVDIWHCDAAGVYSDVVSEGTAGQTFLRGYQLTDSSGLVGASCRATARGEGRAASGAYHSVGFRVAGQLRA
jgi:protocatechuate 3,4-dioxygenase beta subunit